MRRVTQRLVDSFPALMVAVWSAMFAAGGTSLPIAHEGWWQAAAGVMVAANLVSAVWPYNPDFHFTAGVLTLTWLATWTAYLATAWLRADEPLAARLSPWGISQFVVLAVFVAWSYGRKPIRQIHREYDEAANER